MLDAPTYIFDAAEKPSLPWHEVPLIEATDASVKDYGKLVSSPDDVEIEIVRCPLVREESGLARSSRNSNLTPEGREVGVALSRGLFRAREAFDRGERDAARLIAGAAVEIEDPRISLEYLELVDPVTLAPLDAVDPERGGRLLVAARLESVRLIDNIALGGEGGGA